MTITPTLIKGHGTENDFVVLADLDGLVSLSPELVRALCDRNSGIGADGVLRLVRTELATEPDVRAQAAVAEFFMDYHNADGSIAEMCGNGIRVFARYLQRAGLIEGPTLIATRGGARRVSFVGSQVSVEMGIPGIRPETPKVEVAGLPVPIKAIAIDMPNPHVVVLLDQPADLAELDLHAAPSVVPGLPEGQNVEFVVLAGDRHLLMRVYERGVGETRSCGTGICAAVAAIVSLAPPAPEQVSWIVDVPGGRCTVSINPDTGLTLTGPAVLVAEVVLNEDWLVSHR